MDNINWKAVIEQIESKDGEIRTIGKDFYQNKDGRFNEVLSLWQAAGYNSNKVEWINFYPNTHFDDIVSEHFAKSIGLHHARSWISCVRPGKSAPWHQDIDDDIESYQKLGNLERYTCHIGAPSVGQVLVIDKECFYMIPQGTVTKWETYTDWHGASNCGFENHYLYHFLGYK